MTNRRPLTAREKIAQQNLRAIWNAKKKGLGLTQEKAAHILGWSSQGTVGQYLLGRVPLNTDALLKFAGLLQVNPLEIDPEFQYVISPNYGSGKSQSAIEMVTRALGEKQETHSAERTPEGGESILAADIPKHVRELVEAILRKADDGSLTKEHTAALKSTLELMTGHKK